MSHRRKLLVWVLPLLLALAQAEPGNTVEVYGSCTNCTLDTLTIMETTASTTPLTIQGTSSNDLPVYSAEQLSSAGWTVTAGWTENPDDVFTHANGGGTNTLTHNVSITNTTKYQLAWTITNRTAGTITITWGGQTSAAQSVTGAHGPTTSSTAAFTVTPTNDFDGTVVFSLKKITAVSTPSLALKSSDGTIRLGMRANTALGNNFVGEQAGGFTTTGVSNSASGYQALYNNTTGTQNSAQGYQALYSNTTGSINSAVGYQALYSNTTGFENTAQGNRALYSNTLGIHNTAVGYSAAYTNSSGSNNTIYGAYSLYDNTTGANNTAVGYGALTSTNTSDNNTGVGTYALYLNTSGHNNVAHGYQAGRYITDGSTANATSNTSIYLGADTKALASGNANEIVIGYNAIGAGSNTATLGNTSIVTTVLRASTGIGTTGPDRALDVLDASNPQLRLSQTDGTVYTDFQTDSSGFLNVTPSGTGRKVSFVGANGQKTNIHGSSTTVNSAAGATLTATNLIPAGCVVAGVTSRILTAFGVTNGLTSIGIGDGTDPDRWGGGKAITLNATTSNSDVTIATLPVYAAATNIVITGNGDGGNEFDATGQIRITVHCLDVTASAS